MTTYVIAKDRYSLRFKDGKEGHIFKSQKLTGYGCNIEELSICEKMKRQDNKINKDFEIFDCETEQAARDKCAKIGRLMCGICISDLYKTL